MGQFNEVKGNLITMAKEGLFDVITHGCNCQCTMGAGIAVDMAKEFGADRFNLEHITHKSDYNKLGQIDYASFYTKEGEEPRVYLVNKYWSSEGWKRNYCVNSYTQFNYGRNHSNGDKIPLDYYALTLCLRKINHEFKGKHIGLPLIGAGLAGGNWETIKEIMVEELKDMDVTVVHFDDKYLK